MDGGVCLRLAELLLELLSQPERQSDLVVGGAWSGLVLFSNSRHEIGRHITDSCDFFAIAAMNLRAVGGASEWLSASRGRGRAASIMYCAVNALKARAGEMERPDAAAFVASGLFNEALAAVRAFEAAGTARVDDTDPGALMMILAALRQYAHLSAEEQTQLRGVASGLTFAMAPENACDWMGEAGLSSDMYAGQCCASVFGRDEVDAGFVFTQSQVTRMLV